jgi:ATP/maltotriose-dependent transcriptional regulator MalT
LSAKLKRGIYTVPEHHYCDFLRKSHFYSIPLCGNQKLLGILAIVCLEEIMKNELFAITDLLKYRIEKEFINSSSTAVISEKSQVKLNDKQLKILRLIASGEPDKTIATNAGLRLCTIKYHKKNIFRILGVCCSMEAVIKALKLNLISLDQINL